MMLLHLVKKDFLLVKKYILFMMIVSVFVPIFVSLSIPANISYIAFIYTVVFTELILCQFVSVEEGKYPKVAMLLCAAPYPRNTIVKAKYVFFLLLFAYCYVVYSLMALIVPKVGYIDPTIVLLVLMFGIVIYGIYLPLYFKYGHEKTKFFFLIFIMVVAYGIPMSHNYLDIKIDFSVLESISAIIKNLIIIFISVIILSISMLISVRIYSHKEL